MQDVQTSCARFLLCINRLSAGKVSNLRTINPQADDRREPIGRDEQDRQWFMATLREA
jgi:hypothetical protein